MFDVNLHATANSCTTHHRFLYRSIYHHGCRILLSAYLLINQDNAVLRKCGRLCQTASSWQLDSWHSHGVTPWHSYTGCIYFI